MNSGFPWDMAFLFMAFVSVLVVAMLVIMAFAHNGFFA